MKLKSGIEEVIIAYDALTVIVNPANKVSKLTREQLEGIFTGAIKTGKKLVVLTKNSCLFKRLLLELMSSLR
jgi:ABC-type phosphate transport system substrate-binding protein